MAQTIEDVNGRTLLQQFHELYKKQDSIETNVENVDAKVEQETKDRKAADAGLQKLIYQEATELGNEMSGLRNDMNTNTNKIEYNTTQISALKSGKQDKLTAGTNITIDANNVISATGGISSVKAENVDSESATNGQVLTANGSGGASWQTSTGGGDKLYIHTIAFGNSADKSYCKIYSRRQTVFSSMADLGQYLYEKNEIVLTTHKNIVLDAFPNRLYQNPQAIKGINDSSNDYFAWLDSSFNVEMINGSIKLTRNNDDAIWYNGSRLEHFYFADNVSEL